MGRDVRVKWLITCLISAHAAAMPEMLTSEAKLSGDRPGRTLLPDIGFQVGEPLQMPDLSAKILSRDI
jgi:hypothetical protein